MYSVLELEFSRLFRLVSEKEQKMNRRLQRRMVEIRKRLLALHRQMGNKQ
jgi:hypothetical protein